MQYSHSRVELLEKCQLAYRLKYIEGIEIVKDLDANNPLIIGTALHSGVEGQDYEKIYKDHYPVMSTLNYLEVLKLDYLLPKLIKNVNFLTLDSKEYFYEYKLETDDFVGFIDLLVKNNDDTYSIYDFKYSNNIEHYINSRQLHIYKYYFEKTTGYKVKELGYIFIPKTFIRQKKTESEELFRLRLIENLKNMNIKLEYVDFNQSKVDEFFEIINKNKNLKYTCCDNKYCDYCKAVREGAEYMFKLPENKRRNIEKVTKRTLWIYGAPMSGKTTFANKFPEPLMLNTDGNIKFVDAPYIAIKDTVEVTGRITNKTLAWQTFKDVISELEKKQNDFKTIVVDLLEDTYEYCRLYMYDKLNITHESDDSFKAWDKVRTEYLSTIKRLLNLDYENIILLSHEDMSKDIMSKNGNKITSIKPNIQEKLALKVAGMVDLVARCVKDEDYRLEFKNSDVVFGGGRIDLKVNEIPLTFEDFVKIYETETKIEVKEETKSEVTETKAEETVAEEEKPKRKRRRKGEQE